MNLVSLSLVSSLPGGGGRGQHQEFLKLLDDYKPYIDSAPDPDKSLIAVPLILHSPLQNTSKLKISKFC